MSRARVVKALSSLGLEKQDIELYFYLAREGPQEANSLAEALSMIEYDLFSRLETLKKKGIVQAMDEIVPPQFLAVPFEKAVDILVKKNLKQAQVAEKDKKEILKYWESMLKKSLEDETRS